MPLKIRFQIVVSFFKSSRFCSSPLLPFLHIQAFSSQCHTALFSIPLLLYSFPSPLLPLCIHLWGLCISAGTSHLKARPVILSGYWNANPSSLTRTSTPSLQLPCIPVFFPALAKGLWMYHWGPRHSSRDQLDHTYKETHTHTHARTNAHILDNSEARCHLFLRKEMKHGPMYRNYVMQAQQSMAIDTRSGALFHLYMHP